MCLELALRTSAATGNARSSALTRAAPLKSAARVTTEPPCVPAGDRESELELSQGAFRIGASASAGFLLAVQARITTGLAWSLPGTAVPVAAKGRRAAQRAAVGTS